MPRLAVKGHAGRVNMTVDEKLNLFLLVELCNSQRSRVERTIGWRRDSRRPHGGQRRRRKMANREQRSNRETKKPKKAKAPAKGPVSSAPASAGKPNPPPAWKQAPPKG
jgi:DNA replication initiation complex subunit (GINS family)